MNLVPLLVVGAGAAVLLSSRKGAAATRLTCVQPPGGTYVIRNPRDLTDAERMTVQAPDGKARAQVLHRDAGAAYLQLVAAARRDGIPAPFLEIWSGYRTHVQQVAIWNRKVAALRAAHPDWSQAKIESEAVQWVARPGHSVHEGGFGIDFNLGYAYEGKHLDAMRRTPAYKWLVANASRFGFFNYPKEPWHWTYNPICGAAGLGVTPPESYFRVDARYGRPVRYVVGAGMVPVNGRLAA